MLQVGINITKKSKKKKKSLAPPPPDNAPEALDLAAHLKLLGDSITKMGEITGEVGVPGQNFIVKNHVCVKQLKESKIKYPGAQ